MFGVEIFNRGAVRNDVTFEAEFSSQPLSQPVTTTRNGNAIVVVIGAHYTQQPCFFNCGDERRQQYVFNFTRRNLRISPRLSFASAFTNAINGEMFGSGGDRVVFLQALHHLNAEPRGQVWIFTIRVFDSSPTLISRHIESRSIDVRVSQCPRFTSCDPSDFAHKFCVPGVAETRLRGKTRRNWKG